MKPGDMVRIKSKPGVKGSGRNVTVYMVRGDRFYGHWFNGRSPYEQSGWIKTKHVAYIVRYANEIHYLDDFKKELGIGKYSKLVQCFKDILLS